MASDYFKDAKVEPRNKPGELMPLFDRLITPLSDFEDEEQPYKKFYTKAETIQSVEREISRVLNTRTGLQAHTLKLATKEKDSHGIPGFYGIPDFSAHDGVSQAQWPKIEKICQNAIEIYEPRLKNVKVKIHDFIKNEQCLTLSISGRLMLKDYQEEVTFPLRLYS